jgi:hypothetical protein
MAEIILDILAERDYTKISQPIRESAHRNLYYDAVVKRIVEMIDRPGVGNSIISSVFEIAREYDRDKQRPEIALSDQEQRMKTMFVRTHRGVISRNGIAGYEYKKSVGEVEDLVMRAMAQDIDNCEIARALAQSSAGGLFAPMFAEVSALDN